MAVPLTALLAAGGLAFVSVKLAGRDKRPKRVDLALSSSVNRIQISAADLGLGKPANASGGITGAQVCEDMPHGTFIKTVSGGKLDCGDVVGVIGKAADFGNDYLNPFNW